jgi:hypothetical protein
LYLYVYHLYSLSVFSYIIFVSVVYFLQYASSTSVNIMYISREQCHTQLLHMCCQRCAKNIHKGKTETKDISVESSRNSIGIYIEDIVSFFYYLNRIYAFSLEIFKFVCTEAVYNRIQSIDIDLSIISNFTIYLYPEFLSYRIVPCLSVIIRLRACIFDLSIVKEYD